MKKSILLLCLAALAFASVPASAGDDDNPNTGDISSDAAYMSAQDWYFICIQLTNLTGYPVQIDEVSGSGPSRTYFGAGHVIPMDENTPENSVCYIGWRRNNDFMEGPDMNVSFHLVGYEGSSAANPCTFRIVNHYAAWDGNEISPAKSFPASQCQPLADPDDPNGTPVPLYHNVNLPKNGLYLTVVATLAFRDFGGSDGEIPGAVQRQSKQAVKAASARMKTVTKDEFLGGKADAGGFHQ